MLAKHVYPMDPTELFRQLSFHDSVIEDFFLDQSAGLLRLTVEFGNYNQVTYDKAKDPEVIPGKLEFDGVSNFQQEPENALTLWSKHADGEILSAETELMNRDQPIVKLVCVITDYKTRNRETCVFKFESTGVTWRPDSTIAT